MSLDTTGPSRGQAICRLPEMPLKLSVPTNVSRDNCTSISALVEELDERGILNKLDNFYPAAIHGWGNNAQQEFGSPSTTSRVTATRIRAG